MTGVFIFLSSEAQNVTTRCRAYERERGSAGQCLRGRKMFTYSTAADKTGASNPCRVRLSVLVNHRAKGRSGRHLGARRAGYFEHLESSWLRRWHRPCRDGDGIYMQEHERHRPKRATKMRLEAPFAIYGERRNNESADDHKQGRFRSGC
jgi:hypothetical protein